MKYLTNFGTSLKGLTREELAEVYTLASEQVSNAVIVNKYPYPPNPYNSSYNPENCKELWSLSCADGSNLGNFWQIADKLEKEKFPEYFI